MAIAEFQVEFSWHIQLPGGYTDIVYSRRMLPRHLCCVANPNVRLKPHCTTTCYGYTAAVKYIGELVSIGLNGFWDVSLDQTSLSCCRGFYEV